PQRRTIRPRAPRSVNAARSLTGARVLCFAWAPSSAVLEGGMMRSIRAAAALLCVLLCVLSFSTSGAAAQERKAPDALTASPAAGFGDLYFKGRYYLLDDAGLDSWVPGLAPFLKVKAPTADADKGLGTGAWDVGFGLEWDKRFREFFLLGDVSYTVIGEPPGQ